MDVGTVLRPRWATGSRDAGVAIIRAILLALPLVAVLILLGACPSAGGAESRTTKSPPSAETKEKAPATKSTAPQKELSPTTGVGKSGYIEKLEGFASNQASDKDVTVGVSVIPDAFAYAMALGLADLEKRGFEGKDLLSHARSLYSQAKKQKGQVLFRVTVTATGASNYFFLAAEKKVRGHFEVKQKLPKTISAQNPVPVPKFEPWKVFSERVTRMDKRSLCALNRFEMDLLSSSIKLDDKEPVAVSLKDVFVQGQSDDPTESLNVRERQVATRNWDARTIKDLPVEFSPAKWKALPEPPPRFKEWLARLEGK